MRAKTTMSKSLDICKSIPLNFFVCESQFRDKHTSVDVSSIDSLKQAYVKVEGDFGTLDNFVGSAGINKPVDCLETDWEFHLKLVSINQMGIFCQKSLTPSIDVDK